MCWPHKEKGLHTSHKTRTMKRTPLRWLNAMFSQEYKHTRMKVIIDTGKTHKTIDEIIGLQYQDKGSLASKWTITTNWLPSKQPRTDPMRKSCVW